MRTGVFGYAQRDSSRLRMRGRVGLVVGWAAVLLAGCQSSSDMFRAKFTRHQELAAPLTDITGLEVSTNVGALRLEAGEAAEARIVAEITVKACTQEQAEELAGQVRISAEPRGQTLVIKADRPPDLRRQNLSVAFTVTAPARLALDCVTNVGDVHITGFTEGVKARADVGAIASTGLRGPAELHSNVGDIRAEYAADAPAALNISISTNVGRIEFAGPPEISARLTATTNVGSIDTDRPLTVVGSLKHSIDAQLGRAEGRVNLSTNVGSIRIR